MDDAVMREFVNSRYWKVLEKYINKLKDNLKTRCIYADADDVVSIATLQGQFEVLNALQGVINKYREE